MGTIVWFHSHAKFNRDFKLIGTSSREDRSSFWQLPMVLMQSRITSRPSVKVFNGSSPYRRAIFVQKEHGQESARKWAGIWGGGRNGGAEPLFFYFGLSTSPEKIASLKRIRLGFHNGRVPNPVYPPTTIPAFSPTPIPIPIPIPQRFRYVRDVRRKRGAYPWSADKLLKCATLSFRLITGTMREIAFH